MYTKPKPSPSKLFLKNVLPLVFFSISAPVFANTNTYAINVGGQSYVSSDGTSYSEDSFYSGGSPYSTSSEIIGTDSDSLYQSERWGEQFAYELPIVNGSYEVTLKFAEIYFENEGERVFSVQFEGQQRIEALDIASQAGGKNRAHEVRVENVIVEDGALSIALSAQVNNAKLSAIEVTPTLVYHDIAVAYTPAALRAADNDRSTLEKSILDQIDYSNMVYENSGVFLRLRLVDIFEGEDQGSDDYHFPTVLKNTSDGILDNVTEFKEKHGVDFIGIIGSLEQNRGRKGYAYGGFDIDGGIPYFSVTYGEHPTVFTHEVGHVQGLFHSLPPSFTGFLNEYNVGYATTLPTGERVGTVMHGGDNPLPYFSSPELVYKGVSLGVDPKDDPMRGAWAVRFLNENAAEIESWQAPKFAAATSLRAVDIRTSQVKLAWQDNAKREDFYEITVKNELGEEVARFLTDAIQDTQNNNQFGQSSTMEATIHGLRANTYYFAYVRPIGRGVDTNNGEASLPIVFTTKEIVSAPGFISAGSNTKKENLIPGVVEVEHFTAYSDSSKGNSGATYRDTDVDLVENASDSSINVTDVEVGEWLEYALEIEQAGQYKGILRVMPEESTAVSFYLANGKGEPITPNMSVSSQSMRLGGWNDIEFSIGELLPGVTAARIVFNSGGFKVDSIEFVRDFGKGVLEAEDANELSNITVENANNKNFTSNKGFVRGSPLFAYGEQNSAEWSDIQLDAGEHILGLRFKSPDGELADARYYIYGPTGLVKTSIVQTSSSDWEEVTLPFTAAEAGIYRIVYSTRRALRTKKVPDLDFIRIVSMNGAEQSSDSDILLNGVNPNPSTSGVHPDIVTVLDRTLDQIPYAPDPIWWGDSYSVGDQCYCDSTFDHGAGELSVETANGVMTVKQACDLVGSGPGAEGNPRYNDVQCGNGPSNGQYDEDFCPGQINVEGTDEERRLGCNNVGPTWKFPTNSDVEESPQSVTHPDIVTVLDRSLDEIPYAPDPIWWGDSYSVGDQCYCDSTFDHGAGELSVETANGVMTVKQACDLVGSGPGAEGNPRYNDVQCGNGPSNGEYDEDFCPGQINVEGTDEERRLGCNNIGPKWKLPIL